MSKVPGKRSQQQNDFLEPGTPINVVATNVGTNRPYNDGAASISFAQPEGSPPADSYTVTAYKGSTQDTTATNVTGTSSPIVVGGLDSNATYKFTVSATNASGSTGESDFSNNVTITTVPATPVAPTVQNFFNDQNDYLTWSFPTNTGGSALLNTNWESTDGKSGTVAHPDNTETVAQEGATSQQYRVRVSNANGYSQWSPYSGTNTTPPFFPPFFPFFPPFFPFFPFFPPSFPFFPFFPPRFPFFPFFPPRFPFFPFFPPRFPFFPFFPPRFPFFPFFPPRFPFFPFFPPRFPFFPFFPPRFPVFKRFCLSAETPILTATGWVAAGDIKVGDKVVTVDSKHIDLQSLVENKTSGSLQGQISFTEAEVESVEIKRSVLIGFNELGKDYSVTQPIFVKTESGLTYKAGGDIELGDILLGVDVNGDVTETVVTSIQKDDFESEVYDVRTTPERWFITKSFIVIA